MTKSPKGVLPTKREIVAAVQAEIDGWHRCMPDSQRKVDTIRCLEMALCIVREWKQPRRGR